MHKNTTFEHGDKVYEVRAIPTLAVLYILILS